jgi:lipid-binding SYLF domain-containing protein
MKKRHLFALAATVCLVTGLAPRASAHPSIAGTLYSSSDVLDAIQAEPLKCIPQSLLHHAQGVAIIPKVLRVGLGLGGRFGEGVILVRNPDGTWGEPIFIKFTGGSIGWQVGVESVDVILVFKTRGCLDRILKGKGKVTLGADVSIAAGPVGRQAEAATDARLQAEIYSYSRSRGLFAGISLEGSGIFINHEANRVYKEQPRQEDVMAAVKLRNQLTLMCGPPRLPPPVVVPIGPPTQLLPPPAPIAVPGAPIR